MNGHGLKPWDTVKPLKNLFSDISRVVLFDDDHWKAVQGEERNMVVVPCWKSENPQDKLIENLVQQVMGTFGNLPNRGDVRNYTRHLTDSLHPFRSPSPEHSNILPLRRSKGSHSKQKTKRERDRW